MHAFNLCLESVMAGSFAKNIAVQVRSRTAVAIIKNHLLLHCCVFALSSFNIQFRCQHVGMQGQTVATFIRASPLVAAAVASAARTLSITGRVLSGNATRFTSVIRMLESLQRLRSALVEAAQSQPSAFKPAVRAIILCRDFWDDTAALLPILQPFAHAITAIQSLDATLADVLLHWLRLAAAIQRTLLQLPRGKICIMPA